LGRVPVAVLYEGLVEGGGEGLLGRGGEGRLERVGDHVLLLEALDLGQNFLQTDELVQALHVLRVYLLLGVEDNAGLGGFAVLAPVLAAAVDEHLQVVEVLHLIVLLVLAQEHDELLDYGSLLRALVVIRVARSLRLLPLLGGVGCLLGLDAHEFEELLNLVGLRACKDFLLLVLEVEVAVDELEPLGAVLELAGGLAILLVDSCDCVRVGVEYEVEITLALKHLSHRSISLRCRHRMARLEALAALPALLPLTVLGFLALPQVHSLDEDLLVLGALIGLGGRLGLRICRRLGNLVTSCLMLPGDAHSRGLPARSSPLHLHALPLLGLLLTDLPLASLGVRLGGQGFASRGLGLLLHFGASLLLFGLGHLTLLGCCRSNFNRSFGGCLGLRD